MSSELPQTTKINLSTEIAASVVSEELEGADAVYAGLSDEQKTWFLQVAGPLLVSEGIETAQAIERERMNNHRTGEQQLVSEVETFLQIGRALDDMEEGE